VLSILKILHGHALGICSWGRSALWSRQRFGLLDVVDPATEEPYGTSTKSYWLPALCVLAVQVQSIDNTRHGFGLFLLEAWNRHFLPVRNCGFAGCISGLHVRYRLATMSTDTGRNSSIDGSWAYQEPSKQEDWGHLAMHGPVHIRTELLQTTTTPAVPPEGCKVSKQQSSTLKTLMASLQEPQHDGRLTSSRGPKASNPSSCLTARQLSTIDNLFVGEIQTFFYPHLNLGSEQADATDPGKASVGFDLGAYQAKGGKILSYHGLSDAHIPPPEVFDVFLRTSYADAETAGCGRLLLRLPCAGHGALFWYGG
ncbi:hypothetical protein J1614_000590, partial [Plenodomus biglobosus]